MSTEVDTEETEYHGVTKKNTGDRTQDREDNVFSLCDVRLHSE
jgi:hypothetical protein